MTTIVDSRITESSGLAHSERNPDVVWTSNDEVTHPQVFGVSTKTGRTVATFDLDHRRPDDVEALAVHNRTLWVGAIGDNMGDRHDRALYAVTEPGLGSSKALPATKYPITYPSGPTNAECLLIHPGTGHKYIVTKAAHGELYAVPWTLKADQPNMLVKLRPSMPAYVTDGCFTLSGRFVLLRRKGQQNVVVMDSLWRYVKTLPTPRVRQPESITMHPSGDSFYIGSEGPNSPLIRLSLEEGCR